MKKEYLLNWKDPCSAILDNLTLDFMSIGVREIEII